MNSTLLIVLVSSVTAVMISVGITRKMLYINTWVVNVAIQWMITGHPAIMWMWRVPDRRSLISRYTELVIVDKITEKKSFQQTLAQIIIIFR